MAYFPHSLAADADDAPFAFSLSWIGTSAVGSHGFSAGPDAEREARREFDYQKARPGATSVILKRADGSIVASFTKPVTPTTSMLAPLPAPAAAKGMSTAEKVALGVGAVGLLYLVVR